MHDYDSFILQSSIVYGYAELIRDSKEGAED